MILIRSNQLGDKWANESRKPRWLCDCNWLYNLKLNLYFRWWFEDDDHLGAQISQIKFAIDYLHFLQRYNLDSTNWKEFRDGWVLLKALATSARNNRLREILQDILWIDKFGNPKCFAGEENGRYKNADELGHMWTTPSEVLTRIDILEACFSRSGKSSFTNLTIHRDATDGLPFSSAGTDHPWPAEHRVAT